MRAFRLASVIYVPVAMAACFTNACSKHRTAEPSESIIRSSIETATVTLDELKRRPSFDALVLDVASTKDDKGMGDRLPSGELVTNTYVLKLRLRAGEIEFLCPVADLLLGAVRTIMIADIG